MCSVGYTGLNCDTCAIGYYPPSSGSFFCTVCTSVNVNCLQCSSNSLCSLCTVGWTGNTCSTCSVGYVGANCDDCATGYYPSSSGSFVCTICTSINVNCLQCSSSTQCTTCSIGWDGPNCSICAANYIGTLCNICDSGYFKSAGVCVSCSIISPNC